MKKFFIILFLLFFINELFAKSLIDNLIKESCKGCNQKKIYDIKREILNFISHNERTINKILNRELENYLKYLIKKSLYKKENLKKILTYEKLKREKLLKKIREMEKGNRDKNFIIALNRAKRALQNFDYKSYHKYLEDYINRKEHLIILNNIAKAKYLKVNEYYNRNLFDKTKKEIQNSILDRVTNRYLLKYGKILYKIADYDSALNLYFRYLETERDIKNRRLKRASTYNNIGLIYAKKGEYKKALDYYFKDLNIAISNYGEYHQEVAITYNNIAMAYYKMKKYEEAIEYLKKALFIYEITLGENHKNTIGVIKAFDIISNKLVGKGKYE